MAPKLPVSLVVVLIATLVLLISSHVLASTDEQVAAGSTGEMKSRGGGSHKWCCGGDIWYGGKWHCSHWCPCDVYSWCCGGYSYHGGKRHCKHWCH